MHDLTQGDICTVTSGKHKEKTVLVIKAGIQTKFGLRAITVQYFDVDNIGDEMLWVEPEQLAFTKDTDIPTAKAKSDADFEVWKARKNAGVPPASQFKRKSWGGNQ